MIHARRLQRIIVRYILFLITDPGIVYYNLYTRKITRDKMKKLQQTMYKHLHSPSLTGTPVHLYVHAVIQSNQPIT